MGLMKTTAVESDHPDAEARITMQGHLYTRRRTSLPRREHTAPPFKRTWCVLRGGTLFLYYHQNDRHAKVAYATSSAEVQIVGRQEDSSGVRYRLEVVTSEDQVLGRSGSGSLRHSLPHEHHAASAGPSSPQPEHHRRVTTAFEATTEAEMRDWYHALCITNRRMSKDLITPEADAQRAFRAAAVNGELPELRRLLETGLDVNTPFTEGRTALYWAVCNGREEATQLLLRHRADPTRPDADGDTPLHLAAAHGKPVRPAAPPPRRPARARARAPLRPQLRPVLRHPQPPLPPCRGSEWRRRC